MKRVLTAEDVEFAVKGGSVLACGGGGWPEHGRELGNLAVTIGRPELVSLDEVDDVAWIATAAAIGAPGGLTQWQMLGMDYVTAVKRLQEALGKPLYGLIIGQNGMSSTLNAWLPSAVLGTKVIDATVAGGHRASNSYLEATFHGPTAKISPLLRAAADASGGFIASCRNPIDAAYVKRHAALGGISFALALGQAISAAEPRGATAVIDAICRQLHGEILVSGKVTAKVLEYTQSTAFDVGRITIAGPHQDVVVHVMNEHMAVESAAGERLATYPDVITTLMANGEPVSAGRLQVGMEVHLLRVAKQHFALSSSVTDPTVYPIVEKTLGLAIADYALAPV